MNPAPPPTLIPQGPMFDKSMALSREWFWFLYQNFTSAQNVRDETILNSFDQVSQVNTGPAMAREVELRKDAPVSQERWRVSDLERHVGDIQGTNLLPRLAGLENIVAMIQEGNNRKSVAIICDYHAQRANFKASDYPDGAIFYEIDRTVVYITGLLGVRDRWQYIAGIFHSISADRPLDLTIDEDLQFLWHNQTDGITYMGIDVAFSFQFQYYYGIQSDTLASIPTPNPWDIGFLFSANDFLHTYRWDGSGWNWTIGDGGSCWIAGFPFAPPGGADAWALCDGSTVDTATSTGHIGSVVTPNLNTGAFLRTGPYTGPSTSPGSAPTSTVVQAGAGATVSDILIPSDTNGGLPENIGLAWYMRR